MSIYIHSGELVVGNQASQPCAAPIFPEYDADWVLQEMDDFPTRQLDRFQVSEDVKEELRESIPYWRGRTHHDRVMSLAAAAWPPELLHAINLSSLNVDNIIYTGSNCTGDGHATPNYERVLEVGLEHLMGEAVTRGQALDMNQPESLSKRLFYRSVEMSCRAAIDFAARFAALAREMAETEDDPERKGELGEIAGICEQVPARPARSFPEAIQSLWFLQLLIQIESNGHSIPLGRMDQYLYPYYQRDLERGDITREQALQLAECLFVKCSAVNKVRRWKDTQHRSGYPMFQTVTLGGQTAEGMDATNELTYLLLEASGNVKLPQPTVVMRSHSSIPEAAMLAAARSLVSHGGGMPSFFNDDVVISALMNKGVSLADARNWSVMGCSEPQVMGKFLPATGGSHFNLLKILELALNNGVNPATGLQLCPGQGDLSTFRSFDEVWQAFEKQVNFYTSLAPLLSNIVCAAFAELNPCPFFSSLLDYRMEIGKDAAEAGGPNYHIMVSQGHGVASTANSLAAIKKLVFEEKRISGAELLETMAANFEGQRGEELRQLLLNKAPKFGNDDDYVDLLAKKVADCYATAMHGLTNARGVYGPSTQSLTSNIPEGLTTGATPDGRKAGEPLSDNNSPTAGTDVHGPTATALSVAKLDHCQQTNGTILNMLMHPTALEGKDRLRKFSALIRTFFQLKGSQVQFNIVSADMLVDAQLHPENYKNLVVKVAGYSALFSSLDKKLQDQIIQRTSHQVH
jgi:formate C-acetyltransferase